MNIIYAFILTFLASISTILGVIPIFTHINDKFVLNTFKISFLTLVIVSLLELLPDSYILIHNYYNTFVTIIIIIIFYLLGKYLTKYLDNRIGEGDRLYKIGIISMICMIIHNVVEGIITYITSSNNLKLGILVAITIMLHNIPEGLLISIPIYKSTKKRGLALLLTFISSICEFIGSLLSYIFLYKYINNFILGIMYAFTAGIMITISLYEILPIIKKRTF